MSFGVTAPFFAVFFAIVIYFFKLILLVSTSFWNTLGTNTYKYNEFINNISSDKDPLWIKCKTELMNQSNTNRPYTYAYLIYLVYSDLHGRHTKVQAKNKLSSYK